MSSSLFDEQAHFASGVVLARHSDAGYFRVNPPANKWLTAFATPLMPPLRLPPVVASKEHSNRTRLEFQFGEQVMTANQETFGRALRIARFARIPVMLLGSYLLWIACAQLCSQTRLLVQAFWCTSPLILGHGWVVSADAPAGVAMTAILCTSLPLIERPYLKFYCYSGIAWGIAIGTKFTFAPLYLAFPVIIEAYRWATRRKAPLWSMLAKWSFHAFTACFVVNMLYVLQEPLMPIGKHEFISEHFQDFQFARAASQSPFREAVSKMPSPFPRLFLEGIDQQLVDMSFPRGAYLLGSRIEGQLPWFCLVAFWIKEQPAVLFALCIGVVANFARWRNNNKNAQKNLIAGSTNNSSQEVGDNESVIFISVLMLLAILALFTTQVNLVWNMRYLIPAVPLLYVVAANCIPRPRIIDWKLNKFYLICLKAPSLLIAVLLILDLSTKWSHPFSYTNPIFGGNYRIPMALNDSNFDYGQDLRYVDDWIRRRTTVSKKEATIFRVVSGLDRSSLDPFTEVAGQAQIEQALLNAKHRSRRLRMGDDYTPLILSRSLFHAEPWAVRESDVGQLPQRTFALKLLKELLSHKPDAWITPTILVYDCGKN